MINIERRELWERDKQHKAFSKVCMCEAPRAGKP